MLTPQRLAAKLAAPLTLAWIDWLTMLREEVGALAVARIERGTR